MEARASAALKPAYEEADVVDALLLDRDLLVLTGDGLTRFAFGPSAR